MAVSSPNVFGQIWIDGEIQMFDNPIWWDSQRRSPVTFVTLDSTSTVYSVEARGFFEQTGPGYDGGAVSTRAEVENYGTIGHATVGSSPFTDIDGTIYYPYGGSVTNHGHIDTVIVEQYGGFTNYDQFGGVGTVGTVAVRGGGVTIGGGTIDWLSIEAGNVRNYSSSHNLYGYDINNLFVSGGIVANEGNLSTINRASVTGGTLNNSASYVSSVINIQTLELSGGTVNNTGRIGNLHYYSGTFNGIRGDYGAYGRIDTLTLAGNSANNTGNWGIVGHMQFAEDGSGILSFTAALTRSVGISFISDIQVESVDLTYGNIVFDLSSLGVFGESDLSFLTAFSLADIFDGAEVEGVEGLNSFQLMWDENWFYVLNDGVVADGWSFDNGYAAWDGFTAIDWNSNEVPEPATLAMAALGLAGLGLARRRRNKSNADSQRRNIGTRLVR